MQLKGNIEPKLESQIWQCIKLLGEDYMSLNYTIEVYLDHKEYECSNNPDMVLLNDPTKIGVTDDERRLIQLCWYKLKDLKDEHKYNHEIVVNLFHEIRHAWQFEIAEDDAEIFQKNMFNEHTEKISEIFKMPICESKSKDNKTYKEVTCFVFEK